MRINKDKKAVALIEETTQKLKKEGRQVLIVADKFGKEDDTNLSSIEVSRKGNGVIAMLIDLMTNIYEPRGIKFKTAYEYMGMIAKMQGLM